MHRLPCFRSSFSLLGQPVNPFRSLFSEYLFFPFATDSRRQWDTEKSPMVISHAQITLYDFYYYRKSAARRKLRVEVSSGHCFSHCGYSVIEMLMMMGDERQLRKSYVQKVFLSQLNWSLSATQFRCEVCIYEVIVLDSIIAAYSWMKTLQSVTTREIPSW